MSYSSHIAVEDFFDFLDKNLSRIKMYALTCDESTNISVTQNLIIYIRFVKNGKLETHFVALQELEGSSAEDIFTKINYVLNTKGIDSKGLIVMATHGAAVMTGKKSGVVQRFKEQNPFLLAIHCGSHRLALAAHQAAKNQLT